MKETPKPDEAGDQNPQPPASDAQPAVTPDGGSPVTTEQPQKEFFYEQPVWTRFYKFMVGPALVAAMALAIFTVASLLTRESQEPAELVSAIETGGQHRRWQAAFALTKYLQPSVSTGDDASLTREEDSSYQEKLQRVRVLVPNLLSIYQDPKLGDDEVRRFLALAFSYLGDPRLIPALLETLNDSDPELVHYALAAIVRTWEIDPKTTDAAMLENGAAGLFQATKRPEPDVRATAVYVLGALTKTPEATERLRQTLMDPAPAVRWNSAFALARHGNNDGEHVIAEILDRGPLYVAAGPEAVRQADLFLNAVRSAGMVRSPKLQEKLAKIAESDSNLRARDMALKLLNGG